MARMPEEASYVVARARATAVLMCASAGAVAWRTRSRRAEPAAESAAESLVSVRPIVPLASTRHQPPCPAINGWEA